MSRVLFLVNHDVVIYNFRLELVEELLRNRHEVFISCPYGDRIGDLKEMGAIHKNISIDRHGLNPVKDLLLIGRYKRLIKEVKPDIIFSYTIKPNIYGAIAAKRYGVPLVANITGLGTAVENPGFKQKICVALYRYAFKKVQKVFFQNKENLSFFLDNKIIKNKYELLCGSGVNLEKFRPIPYPAGKVIKFAFVGRIMKEKGIDYFLEAAKKTREKYDNAEFHVYGFVESEYRGKLKQFVEEGVVIYHGMVKDNKSIYKDIHCLVFPSFYPEGISNVLLEAGASARPLITTDRAGCREVIDDGVNGFMVPVHNQRVLEDRIELFLKLSNATREEMGKKSREKVEKEFDRKIVVDKYLKELRQ